MKTISIFLASFLITGLQMLSAATLTFEGVTSATGNTYDLTAYGDVDWAYWSTADNPASGSPANSMSGGTGIGSIAGVGTSDPRGAGSLVDVKYSFTNGANTASGLTPLVSGLLNDTLNAPGEGVQLDFTLATAGQAYTVYVWTGGFATQKANIKASLTGASDYDSGLVGGTAQSGNYGDNSQPKQAYLYEFTAIADTDNDLLNFSIETGGVQSGSGHVIITAGAISVVPEPSTFALLLGSLALSVVMLRRRR